MWCKNAGAGIILLTRKQCQQDYGAPQDVSSYSSLVNSPLPKVYLCFVPCATPLRQIHVRSSLQYAVRLIGAMPLSGFLGVCAAFQASGLKNYFLKTLRQVS